MLDRVIRFGDARDIKARARRLAIYCVVVASLALLASGTILQAQEAGAVRERLQARLSELQAKSGVPGGTAGIVLPDGSSFELAAGTSDVKRKIPMKPGGLFMAGSTGKTFVAAIILQLVGENRIQLVKGHALASLAERSRSVRVNLHRAPDSGAKLLRVADPRQVKTAAVDVELNVAGLKVLQSVIVAGGHVEP